MLPYVFIIILHVFQTTIMSVTSEQSCITRRAQLQDRNMEDLLYLEHNTPPKS